MHEDGYRALLAFYNQTFHGMTMAAGLRSTGSSFRIDSRLAANMLCNVEGVIKALRGNPNQQRFVSAWTRAQSWLHALSGATEGSDHGADLYELNGLAYATWTKLCDNPRAKHYAEEHYTVFAHPNKHPGVNAIRRIWSSSSDSSETPSTRATLANLAALVEGDQNKPNQEIEPPSNTSGLDS